MYRLTRRLSFTLVTLTIAVIPLLVNLGSLASPRQMYSMMDESKWVDYVAEDYFSALETETRQLADMGRFTIMLYAEYLAIPRIDPSPRTFRLWRVGTVFLLALVMIWAVFASGGSTLFLGSVFFLIGWFHLSTYPNFHMLVSFSSFTELQGVVLSIVLLVIALEKQPIGMVKASVVLLLGAAMFGYKEPFGPIAAFLTGVIMVRQYWVGNRRSGIFLSLGAGLLTFLLLSFFVYKSRKGYSGRYQFLFADTFEAWGHFLNFAFRDGLFWIVVGSMVLLALTCALTKMRMSRPNWWALFLPATLAFLYFVMLYPWAGDWFTTWYYLPSLVWLLLGAVMFVVSLIPEGGANKVATLIFLVTVVVWSGRTVPKAVTSIREDSEKKYEQYLLLENLVSVAPSQDSEILIISESPETPARLSQASRQLFGMAEPLRFAWRTSPSAEDLSRLMNQKPIVAVFEASSKMEVLKEVSSHFSNPIRLGGFVLLVRQ